MADQFSNWDRFNAHHTLTQDPQKALRWTRYEAWAEERRLERLRRQADSLATESLLRAERGAASKKTT